MTTSQVERRTFLVHLQKSGLFEEKELRQLWQELPRTGEGRELAQHLMQQGKLTKFQADNLLAGKIKGFVIGQYRILDMLGRGGLGRVFKALHKTMNRVVALKLLAPELVSTERARELFQHEVLAAGRLQHPNIATAYDASTTGKRYYLVMEYIDGPNLEQLVQRRGPLRPGLACEILRQAALALQYAHGMGMLHRDIKPANILIQKGQGTNDFTVKVVDFGLARLQSAGDGATTMHKTILLPQNKVMGTPDYLSPEQARSLHAVDVRSDLYSLGCTLYFLLTGRVPFPGGTPLEKMLRHANAEPQPVTELRPDLPAEVVQIVACLMAKSPQQRYQTTAELIAALTPLAAPAAGSSLLMRSLGSPTADTGKLAAMEKSASNGELPATWPQAVGPTPLLMEEDETPAISTGSVVPYVLLTATGLILLAVAVVSYLLFHA